MLVLRAFCCCAQRGARLAPTHVVLDEEAEELVEVLQGAMVCCWAVQVFETKKPSHPEELRFCLYCCSCWVFTAEHVCIRVARMVLNLRSCWAVNTAVVTDSATEPCVHQMVLHGQAETPFNRYPSTR